MMRAAEATGAYKRFLGSSFLSDFTLIICCESAVEEPSSSDLTATPSLQHSGATAGEQEPGTPDNGLSPRSAAAAAAAGHAQSLVGAAADAAAAQADASADAPCSGQQHPDLPDILQHSPHHAAPALGAVCSPRLLQGTAMPAQRPGFADPAAATAAGPGSAVGSSPSSLLTVSSTGAAAAAAASSTSAGSGSSHSAAANNTAGADTLLTVPAPSPDSKAAGGGSGGSMTAISKLQEANTTSSCSSSSTAIVMPVHGVVLAAASPYFETLLRGWASSHQPLHMVVGEDQLQAAQQLLAFIYIGSLQPGLQQADLLQLLLLADRFDVSRAVAAARRALASLSPECFEWPTLTGVWSLPPHLFECEGDEAAALRGVAWERLLQLFGDLEEAWSTADGRAMWQQLPWRAVSALVASDALAVASENTTFAAVSSWIAHQQHQQHQQQLLQEQQGGSNLSSQNPAGPTPQELQLLAASIRIPSLGPCYLSYVSLQQDWFASAVDVASLARAAAFAAAAPEVRKDLIDFTATTTAAAMQAAAAAAPSRHGCCHSGSNAGSNDSLAAPAIAGSDCIGSSLGPWGAAGVVGYSRGGSCGGCHGGASMAAVGCGSSGSNAIEHKAQLLALTQAMQRPRGLSSKRAGQFGWRVDIAAIRQLYDDVAAAGSRDSRILRSPAHSFAGYEWALQLEVTQTRGATGFDVSKPWSLGVFLTCQVRLEQPAHSSRADRSQQSPSPVAGATGVGTPTEAAGAGAAAGDVTRRFSSSSGSSGYFGSDGAGKGAGKSGAAAAAAAGGIGQQQQQLVMQLFDFGFVSTSATIAVREAGAANKRTEKSWEHAVVRYRASWGWPNYLDAQAVGWDESLFSRWLIDGQLHLSARVRVLG